MKRFICMILCVLIVSAVPSALSASAVDDQALVLIPALTAEIDAFNLQLRLAADFEISVITRDFLGGKNVSAYTNQALKSLDSSGNLLLVMVIGEDAYEVALGSNAQKHISHEKVERLPSDLVIITRRSLPSWYVLERFCKHKPAFPFRKPVACPNLRSRNQSACQRRPPNLRSI